ncbi:MAG: hypothetical protein QXO00_07585 [Candidatus Bathyarchaeia archaeon]
MREIPLILFGFLLLISPSLADCGYMVCSSAGCKCLDNATSTNATANQTLQVQTCANSIYYTYSGNATAELYIGGYIFFPKTIADRIKVSGGVTEKEDECGWMIKVSQNAVTVQFVKLSDNDFSYGTRNFNAKEYPAELFKPVEPEEIRIKLIELNETISKFEKELKSIKLDVKTVASKPTFSEELKGFLLYFPPIWVLYTILGVVGFIALLGWWYARD